MTTSYLLKYLDADGKTICNQEFSNKGSSLDAYKLLCETHPTANFELEEVVVSKKVIAKSDDYRQSKFDF